MVSLVNLIKYFRKNINFTQTQKIEEKVAERKLHKIYLIKDLYIKNYIIHTQNKEYIGIRPGKVGCGWRGSRGKN